MSLERSIKIEGIAITRTVFDPERTKESFGVEMRMRNRYAHSAVDIHDLKFNLRVMVANPGLSQPLSDQNVLDECALLFQSVADALRNSISRQQ